MKWKRVKGRGDMQRGVSFPNYSAAARRLPPSNELGYSMDSYLDDSKRSWGTAAASSRWAVESRNRAMRDAQIGGPRPTMGPKKPLPTLTMKKAKPKSIMHNVWLGQATYVPAKRRG